MSIATKPFVRNVTVMATGTFGAHGINIAFTPLITRLYGPEPFGIFGIFAAILAILVPLAALALPIAIVLPDNEQEASEISRISSILCLAISILIAAMIFTVGDQITARLSMASIENYILLLPLALFATGLTQIFRQWQIRQQQFRKIANAGIIHAAVVNIIFIACGLLYPFALTLIIITVAGQGFLALLLRHGIKKDKHARNNRNFLEILNRYRDFPLYRAPQNLINAVSQSLPVVMMASLFGASAAGFYALAKMAMGAPSALLGTSIRDVFYPKVTRMSQQGIDIQRPIIKATIGLAFIGALPFLVVFAFGPQLFSLVFGEEWRVAGEYASWLTLFFFFNLINKPSVAAVPVLGIQRGLLIYEIFSTTGKLFGLAVGYYFFQSDIVAVAAFSIIGMIAYTAMIAWIIFKAKARGSNVQDTG